MSYPGAKNGAGVWQRIISVMPHHSAYVECFAGEGAIIRRKRPAFLANYAIDIDQVAADRLAGILPAGSYAFQGDALNVLPNMACLKRRDALVYADPPYLRSVRTAKRLYRHEFDTPEQHTALIEVLRALPCYVMLSGYRSPLYRKLLKGWRCIQYNTMTRGGPRVECLWMNFPEGLPLHDTRWVGEDYRERERIGRKRRRWVSRLLTMPAAEQQAIFEACQAAAIANDDDAAESIDPRRPRRGSTPRATPITAGMDPAVLIAGRDGEAASQEGRAA
jgi:DNA adenine methylase